MQTARARDLLSHLVMLDFQSQSFSGMTRPTSIGLQNASLPLDYQEWDGLSPRYHPANS